MYHNILRTEELSAEAESDTVHLPATDISKCEEVLVEIVHLYHCDHKKKCWSE
jgi:hypothetical protein